MVRYRQPGAEAADYLASGIDDLNSETTVLPNSAYRFIATIEGALMLFEVLEAPSEEGVDMAGLV